MNQQDPIQSPADILEAYQLCDMCLGRLFRTPSERITNTEKGTQIRTQLKIKKATKPKQCVLCEGVLEEIPHFVKLISETLKPYEYTSFLIGCKLDDDIITKEQELIAAVHSKSTDTLKMQLNRDIGRILEDSLGKTVDFERPDINAVIDTRFDVVHLQIKSLYMYGRYKKLKRGIPQTKWPCRICRGIGCRACNYIGKQYETSVEELIAHHILKKTGGTDESFHGCGREDIDARMLGNGRPFVLEVKNPKTRTLSYKTIEKQINSLHKDVIEVTNLRSSDMVEVVRIKDADFQKTYAVTIESATPLNKEKLIKAAQVLRGTTIQQFTPSRVAHRRAHMIRERKVYNCEIDCVEGTRARLTIETESGTYVKELISGDDGNTTPSLSALLETPCTVTELDVIDIKGE